MESGEDKREEDETEDNETEDDTEEEEKSESDEELIEDKSPEAGPSCKQVLLTNGNKIMIIVSF